MVELQAVNSVSSTLISPADRANFRRSSEKLANFFENQNEQKGRISTYYLGRTEKFEENRNSMGRLPGERNNLRQRTRERRRATDRTRRMLSEPRIHALEVEHVPAIRQQSQNLALPVIPQADGAARRILPLLLVEQLGVRGENRFVDALNRFRGRVPDPGRRRHVRRRGLRVPGAEVGGQGHGRDEEEDADGDAEAVRETAHPGGLKGVAGGVHGGESGDACGGKAFSRGELRM